MFPHVNGQQRLHPFRQRQIRIAGLGNLQLVPIFHQPCPATAKLRRRRGRQLFLACLNAAERRLDLLLQCRRRLATALGREAVPIEGMVPDLRRIIENSGFVRLVQLLT